MEKISAAALEPEAVDIPTFCLLNSISRAALYELWRRGEGPKIMKVGKRVLITREARSEWRRWREQATRQPGQGPKEV